MNECSQDPAPCGEEEYCVNNDGSFSCKGERWEPSDILAVHAHIVYPRLTEVIIICTMVTISTTTLVFSGILSTNSNQCKDCKPMQGLLIPHEELLPSHNVCQGVTRCVPVVPPPGRTGVGSVPPVTRTSRAPAQVRPGSHDTRQNHSPGSFLYETLLL